MVENPQVIVAPFEGVASAQVPQSQPKSQYLALQLVDSKFELLGVLKLVVALSLAANLLLPERTDPGRKFQFALRRAI